MNAATFVCLVFSGTERQIFAQNRNEIWLQAHWPWLHAWPWIDRHWPDTVKIQRPNWSGIPHTGGESTRVSSFSTPSPCCFTMIKLHKTRAYIYYVRGFSEYSIPLCDVFRRGVNWPATSQRRSRLTCWTTRWKRSAVTTWDNWLDDRNIVIKCNGCSRRYIIQAVRDLIHFNF